MEKPLTKKELIDTFIVACENPKMHIGLFNPKKPASAFVGHEQGLRLQRKRIKYGELMSFKLTRLENKVCVNALKVRFMQHAIDRVQEEIKEFRGKKYGAVLSAGK